MNHEPERGMKWLEGLWYWVGGVVLGWILTRWGILP
jgi:hypothetical protein